MSYRRGLGRVGQLGMVEGWMVVVMDEVWWWWGFIVQQKERPQQE